jgi:hydroxyacyl-ACP dehydratase HTD2-like protein with hotdog domain
LKANARLSDLQPGDCLPETKYITDITQQFMYNAALWNAHRIHFDLAYATEIEGYPGLVIAGPLMGDWLTQCINEWLGDDGQLVSFEYSNRRAAYVGDVLHAGGKVVSIEAETRTVVLELQVTGETGEIVTPGTAVVRFAV